MKIQDLEHRIDIRANDAAQRKISQFKKEIDEALNKLFGKTGTGGENFGSYSFFEGKKEQHQAVGRMKLEALQMAICDNTKTDGGQKSFLPWPSIIWEKERDSIRHELLEKMDLMQQLLLTKDRKSDADADVPEEVSATS